MRVKFNVSFEIPDLIAADLYGEEMFSKADAKADPKRFARARSRAMVEVLRAMRVEVRDLVLGYEGRRAKTVVEVRA